MQGFKSRVPWQLNAFCPMSPPAGAEKPGQTERSRLKKTKIVLKIMIAFFKNQEVKRDKK